MDAPWLAVTVERPGASIEGAARARLDEAMKLAESLGAEIQTLTGSDLPAELLRFAKFENVTQIVIGHSQGGFSEELLRRSLPHELMRRSPGIAVHVVTRETDAAAGPARVARLAGEPLSFIYATLAVGAMVVIGATHAGDAASESLGHIPAGGAADRRAVRHLACDLCLRAVVSDVQLLLH
jgi:two-component system sensor histidine kinase KdpD